VERTHDSALVRDYEVVKEEYRDGDTYWEAIEVPTRSSRKQLLATLEDALIKAVNRRRDRKHAVRIRAYYTYPATEAGRVKWQPGRKPDYKIADRDVEDQLKDTLFDVLRGR
jgi:hypothetical protein